MMCQKVWKGRGVSGGVEGTWPVKGFGGGVHTRTGGVEGIWCVREYKKGMEFQALWRGT